MTQFLSDPARSAAFDRAREYLCSIKDDRVFKTSELAQAIGLGVRTLSDQKARAMEAGLCLQGPRYVVWVSPKARKLLLEAWGKDGQK